MENAIDTACWDVPEVGSVLEIIPEAKVIKLGESITNIWQKIVELDAKLVPSTSPEVVKQWKTQVQEFFWDIK